MINSDPDPGFLATPRSVNYIQQETWFEVSRGTENFGDDKIAVRKPYIDIINSYGRLRRLYTDTGTYKDMSNGGTEKASSDE